MMRIALQSLILALSGLMLFAAGPAAASTPKVILVEKHGATW